MFFINNFKKYQPKTYRNCINAVNRAKYKANTYYLNKASFIKATAKSFDYAILEKTKQINAIKLDIPWSDLGSWKEILKMYDKNKNKYIKKKNIYYRPWGRYTNLFEGKEIINYKGKLVTSSNNFTYIFDEKSGSLLYKKNFISS